MRKFLNDCAAIEETIAAIYRQLAEALPCDEELKAIWRKMADEEDQHAIQIGLAARLPYKETFRGENLTPAKVEQLLHRARTILAGVRSAGMTEEDALRVSLKLEGEFMAVHVASAAEFLDGKMREMFRCLARGDEEHHRALEEYHARRFGQKLVATA